MMIRYFLYNLILTLAVPTVFIYLLASQKYRRLIRRFHPVVPAFNVSPIWIHACSVGEINVARGLIRDLRDKTPNAPVLLSVSTLSGHELASSLSLNAAVVFAPFDSIFSVRGFLRRAKPCVLVIVETEMWPNLIREASRCSVPVIIVNGRISPKKFPTYMRYKSLLPPINRYVTAIAAQNEIYADRFNAIGIDAAKVEVTGNMKNDAVVTEVPQEQCITLCRENGFSRNDIIVTFGSTRPGDEQLAAHCWEALKDEYPALRFVVAPRHLQRLDEALLPFQDELVSRRNDVIEGRQNWHARVFFVDTIGELVRFYAVSTIAVIGGSFFPGVEGHNPLEPAALGIPTVFGPYMGNFPDAAQMLLDSDGALQVKDADELVAALRSLIVNPLLRERMGRKGRKAVLNSCGAIERNTATIMRYIQ